MSTQNNLTVCEYLFNKEASTLFVNQDDAFVNESLLTLINVIDDLINKNPKMFFVFDPAAFNNQCHLYALMVARAITNIQRVVTRTLSPGEGTETTLDSYSEKNIPRDQEFVDRRFLYLSFLLSYAFISDPKLLVQVVEKDLGVKQSKKFELFLKDLVNKQAKDSRIALNQLFAEYMKNTLSASGDSFFSELLQIAHSDLQLAPSSGTESLYTFPKFAGVVYMIDAIFREKIPLLFKVKVVTKEGNGSFIYSGQSIAALDDATPVVVFELIATDDSLTFEECREIAKSCPNYSQRNVRSSNRHDPTKSCIFCASSSVDTTQYQERFQPILEKDDEMLLALGADFVLQHQRSFLPIFMDSRQFPQLTALFEKSLNNIESFFLSMTKPLHMSVSHVYTDCASQAS